MPEGMSITCEAELAVRTIVKEGDVTTIQETARTNRIVHTFPSGRHKVLSGNMQLFKPDGQVPFETFRSLFTQEIPASMKDLSQFYQIHFFMPQMHKDAQNCPVR